MPEKASPQKHQSTTVVLLGASFDTGNLGVSALAESSIKIILHRWPDCEIVMLGVGREPGQCRVSVCGREVAIKTLPIRFCPNILAQNHYLKLLFWVILARFIPANCLRKRLVARKDTVGTLFRSELIADITGGDSFSDIYGMQRFIRGFLTKSLFLWAGKKLIMLPQTYGPFQRPITRLLAGYVLRRCEVVWSRDQQGGDTLKKLLGDEFVAEKVRFSPDVAFVLDARRPKNPAIDKLEHLKKLGRTIVGLNISGLLYNGGYTQDNMFGLKVDYPKLMIEILKYFAAMPNVSMLLVPHVFPTDDMAVESDPIACKKIYNALPEKSRGKVTLPEGRFDQCQIKYIIGQCDFFMGSRMHSCIAAISQCIPTIGLAYSKKFSGVFESVQIEDCVIDMRNLDNAEMLFQIKQLFSKKQDLNSRLKSIIPETKERVLALFDSVKFKKN